MKLEDIKKGIQDLKNIRLTDFEKFSVKSNLDFYIETSYTSAPERISPWISFYNLHSRGLSFSFVMLLLVGFSINTINGAQSALPGDVLYPLKVNVIEPLEYTTTIDPVAKANLEVSNLDTRLREAEKLQVEGRLSDSLSQEIQNRINNHSESFNKILDNLNSQNTLPADSDLKIDFEAKLSAHSKIIDSIDNSNDQDTNLKKIKKIIFQNANKDAMEVRSEAVPSVMMFSKIENPVQDVSSSSSKKESSIDSGFVRRKKETQDIIKSVKNSIERSKKNNSIRNKILIEAENSILDAENSLRDAENDSKSGDVQSANLNLQNSRKWAKEAGTTFEVSQDLPIQEKD